MYLIDSFILELFNIMPHPHRFNAFTGTMMILWFLLFSLVVFFPIFFIMRTLQKRNPISSNFSLTVPFSLTLTAFLAFLATVIFSIIQLSYFNWEYFDLYKSDFLLSLIPFCFFLLLTISFFVWYRYRKKHKVISKVSAIESQEEV